MPRPYPYGRGTLQKGWRRSELSAPTRLGLGGFKAASGTTIDSLSSKRTTAGNQVPLRGDGSGPQPKLFLATLPARLFMAR
jgi:hypothetical protein